MPRPDRSATTPIQDLSALLELWRWWLKEDYAVDLTVTDPAPEHAAPATRHHYLFGTYEPRPAAADEVMHSDESVDTVLDTLHRAEPLPGCRKPARISGTRIAVFNQDLAYLAALQTGPQKVEIHFELRSQAFQKGRIPDYATVVRLGRKWLIRPHHPEIASLAGFEADIDECLREIFLAASSGSHPYQSYIDANPDAYRQALAGPRRLPD